MANHNAIVINCRILPTAHISKWLAYLKCSQDESIIKKVAADPKAVSFKFRGNHYLWFYWFTFKMIYE